MLGLDTSGPARVALGSLPKGRDPRRAHQLDAPGHLRRFTRLSNGFSRKRENLRAALALYFAYYNFVRMHKSIRMTPAMAAGIARKPWSLADLLRESTVTAP